MGSFPGYLPGYVEEGGLEEEEEDHPLVVLVVDNIMFLARLDWGHTRVRLVQANLIEVAHTILLLGCSKSVI